jgi:hypothetical protein
MQRKKMRDQSAFGTKNGEAKKKKNKNLKKIKKETRFSPPLTKNLKTYFVTAYLLVTTQEKAHPQPPSPRLKIMAKPSLFHAYSHHHWQPPFKTHD